MAMGRKNAYHDLEKENGTKMYGQFTEEDILDMMFDIDDDFNDEDDGTGSAMGK